MTYQDPWVTSDSQKARIISIAIAQIEQFGWCKGLMRSPTGSMCAIGALRQAVSISRVIPSTFGFVNNESQAVRITDKIANDVADEIIPDGKLMAFNDAPGRTRDEVIDKMREAVERLGEGIPDNGGLVAVSGQEAAQGA